jgi:hypothetical protein
MLSIGPAAGTIREIHSDYKFDFGGEGWMPAE